jgi:hypothetical protein
LSRPLVNELEERRVIRLLASVAEEVTPLADVDVDSILRRAMAGSGRRARRRFDLPLRYLPAVAAAAAIVIGVSIGSDRSASPQQAPSDARFDTRLASFPQGSALSVLLTRAESRDKA